MWIVAPQVSKHADEKKSGSDSKQEKSNDEEPISAWWYVLLAVIVLGFAASVILGFALAFNLLGFVHNWKEAVAVSVIASISIWPFVHTVTTVRND